MCLKNLRTKYPVDNNEMNVIVGKVRNACGKINFAKKLNVYF